MSCSIFLFNYLFCRIRCWTRWSILQEFFVRTTPLEGYFYGHINFQNNNSNSCIIEQRADMFQRRHLNTDVEYKETNRWITIYFYVKPCLPDFTASAGLEKPGNSSLAEISTVNALAFLQEASGWRPRTCPS